MFDPTSIVSLVSGHGVVLYGTILLITIFEGPMFTVIAASLIATGVFSVIPILSLIILGDVIGDSMHYSIGRFAGRPLLNRFSLTETALHKTKDYFERHPIAMLILSKLAHGAGAAGLIVAGAVRVPYRKYVTRCFLITLGQSFTLLTLGLLAGNAYMRIARSLDIYATATIVIGITLMLFILIRRMSAKLSSKMVERN